MYWKMKRLIHHLLQLFAKYDANDLVRLVKGSTFGQISVRLIELRSTKWINWFEGRTFHELSSSKKVLLDVFCHIIVLQSGSSCSIN